MAAITTKEELITPKQAEETLAEHYERIAESIFRQRPLTKSIVRKYVTDMNSGHWNLCPQPIVFDELGNLTDGQHRLEAVRQSGKTIKFMVSRGWPCGVIDLIDRGKSRTVAHQLHLHGCANATTVASAVAAAVRVCYRGEAPAISYASCIHLLETLDLRRHIEKMLELRASMKTVSGRMIGPLAFYRTVNAKKADEFMERIVNMGMEKGTGPAIYAKYLRDNTINDQSTVVRALCACIKLWDEGETAAHIRQGFHGTEWLADRNRKLNAAIHELLGEKSPSS